MPARFLILCGCLLPPLVQTMYAQPPWSLQSLTPVVQSSGLIHAAVSATGDVYIAGPPGAFTWPQPTNTIGDTSSEALLVSKLDPSGNPLYATAIGGTGVAFLALDGAGNLYVYGGYADGEAFATTAGAFDAGADVSSGDFVCKLNAADGSILFCSFPGTAGGETGGFTADSMGNVYFAEIPPTPIYDYPLNATEGALALGTRSVQVTKLSPIGAIVYRAEFGGTQEPAGSASIAVDAQGDVWVAGSAYPDFPTTPNALLPSAPQSPAGFLTELNPSGSALLYSTFTDGLGIDAQIALDGTGAIYLADFNTADVGILRKYSPGGTALSYEQDFASGLGPFVATPAGEITILGTTSSVNFPTNQPVAPCGPSGAFGDWVLIIVDAAGKVIDSTFLPIATPYISLLQLAPNGYFLMTSTPTSDASAGPFQFELGQLGPATGPPINLTCVGNAAGLVIAALAPGEIVSLFGTGLGPSSPVSAQFANNLLPFNLAGTQVTFNGVPAPLLYSSDGQINAIAPWEIQGASTANVCVVFQGSSTNCVTLDVSNTAPGIFSLPSGYAAAVNQDGTINSPQNPATVGSIVSIYVTGLGPLSSEPADGSVVGLPLPTLVNGVQVGFIPSFPPFWNAGEVQYAGPAPFEVAGLYQINVKIPTLPTSFDPTIPTSYAVAIGVINLGPGPEMFVPTSNSLPIAIQ
jgi:uncharacterized protein (TIGR03437 family)